MLTLATSVRYLWNKVFGFAPTASSRMTMHTKCRNMPYPRDNVKRLPVPDDMVSWNVEYSGYTPVSHTTSVVLSMPVWADVDFEVEKAPDNIWNRIDAKSRIDRTSHDGPYEIVNGLPRNPVGRTGLRGRGLLGRWGPNHAADPIVTRWKRDKRGREVFGTSNKRILQFVSIQRQDSKEWALPGGMVDPGELVSVTVKREFLEEAMNSEEMTDDERKKISESLDSFFAHSTKIYAGYVDDPRNTDNAWMETVAYNFHDETGEQVGKLHLHAGDDAVGVMWRDIDSNLKLYASHIDFIKTTVDKLSAHW